MDKLAILIINWNDYINTVECIKSLKLNNKDKNYNLIVLDNNSKDGSREKIIQEFKLQEIIPSDWNCEKQDIFKQDKLFKNYNGGDVCLSLNDNYGFTGANNFGMKFAWQHSFKYIMRLNNDTITTKNFINNMINGSKQNFNTLLSCRILFYPETDYIRGLGGAFNRFGKPYGINTNKKSKDVIYNEEYINSELCTGCCLIMTRETMSKIGGQDNNFFFNVDDSDYSYYAKSQGINSKIDTKTILYHKSARSVVDKPGLSMYYGLRNLVLFRRKYFTWYKNIGICIYILIHSFGVLIIYGLKGKNTIPFLKDLFYDIIYKNYGRYNKKI